MDGLAYLAAADLAERQKAAYNADMMWFTAKVVYSFAGGKNFDIESPSRFAHAIDSSHRPRDNRSTQQIKDDILAFLRK